MSDAANQNNHPMPLFKVLSFVSKVVNLMIVL